jgi:glyoxalase family protein
MDRSIFPLLNPANDPAHPVREPIRGIHHITAIAKDPQRTLDFYTKVLGLHLVKLTVNFDDPSSYHYYFANASGDPGSVLTFFPWPAAARGGGRQGTGSVTATAFNVQEDSLPFWARRLESAGVSSSELRRLGDRVLTFVDPDGMPLELIASPGFPSVASHPGSDIPAESMVRGFHSATLALHDAQPTLRLLRDVMGFRVVATEGDRTRLVAPGQASHAQIIDLLHQPTALSSKLGAGVVHHIAFRMEHDGAQRAWSDHLQHAAGMRVTGVANRDYFRSVYFREPGGVLFELATDVPGFAIDEPAERLGSALMLPAQYEHARAAITRALPRITLPNGATVGQKSGGGA